MKYRKFSESGFARLLLCGRLTGLDSGAAGAIRSIIAEIRTGVERHWVLDLSGLEFIDSAGIGLLLVANGEASNVGRPLSMVLGGEGQVARALDLTRITMIIPAYETVEAFAASCAPDTALGAHPCAPDGHPLAAAARALTLARE